MAGRGTAKTRSFIKVLCVRNLSYCESKVLKNQFAYYLQLYL